MSSKETISMESDSHPAFADKFAVSWVESARIESDSANISFEAEVWHHRSGQKLFIGLLDKNLRSGVGIGIDTASGEILDMINDQGIIGYLDDAALPEGGPVTVRVELDKFGTTHICSLEICGESILYPAVLLDQAYEIGGVLGSTLCKGHAITFENTVLKVSENVGAAA